MIDNEALEAYTKDRDTAIVESLINDSVEPFKAFIAKYKELGVLPQKMLVEPDDKVLAITIRKMSLVIDLTPVNLKGEAVNWLIERGLHLEL